MNNPRPSLSLWIGYDPREQAAYDVARFSASRHCNMKALRPNGLVLADLQARGLYTRPIEFRKSELEKPIMWDPISEASMSTQHANARFLIKEIAKTGWAMFADGDVLFRADVSDIFSKLSPHVPLYCVKHDYTPKETVKMDGQVQQKYTAKNQSSVFVINCDHEANRALTVDLINSVPGRDLHRWCWLNTADIGELDPAWNYLVGESPKLADPKVAHFTLGIPDMPGYADCEFADEWRAELLRFVA